MLYLLLGNDIQAKDQQIQKIKKETVPSKEAREFDWDTLYAAKLDAEELQKTLKNLPVTSGQRGVVIRNIESLSPANKNYILEFLSTKPDYLKLILESDFSSKGTARRAPTFIEKIKKQAKTMCFDSKDSQHNVFDVTNQIARRNSAGALKTLTQMFDEGTHPLQIMGGLLWFWGKEKNKISKENYQRGLNDLQETDLNIKRSRMAPEQAMEVLVVKLTELI